MVKEAEDRMQGTLRWRGWEEEIQLRRLRGGSLGSRRQEEKVWHEGENTHLTRHHGEVPLGEDRQPGTKH